MRNRDLAAQRKCLLPAARGRVLEIGIGSGLNLPFYPPEVDSLVGIDPSEKLLAMTRKKVPGLAFTVELVRDGAERLSFENDSFDNVVTTWTLCSIAEAGAALSEMRRVLKPEGELIFIEHGQAPEPKVARWQDRVNPIWRRFAGGCNLNRPIEQMITGAGFAMTAFETGYLIKGPRTHTFHYKGRAVKA
jgi:ubiquinone/menaquinone biosynthesis C-methylase UbiE